MDTFYADLLVWLRHVYADIDGRPALVGHTETVGVGLELIMFTSDEVAERYEGQGLFPQIDGGQVHLPRKTRSPRTRGSAHVA